MLKGILLVFVPIGAACLAFATGASAIYRGEDLALASVILFVAGVLLAYSAIRAIGSGVFASYGKAMDEKDMANNVDPSIQKDHQKKAVLFLVAGAVLFVVGLLVGGEPLLAIINSVLSA